MAELTNQQAEAVTCDRNRILVSAGAGSGKTHVLVERYIERLKRDPQLSVGQIIAVTFTRKAANEMRIRLKTRLRGLLQQSSGTERERWTACLSQIDGAKIGTIHSLCESIIKAFPLDAGVDPQLEVLDDLAQAELMQASIDQALREVIAQQLPEHNLLLEFDLAQIRQWITRALKSSLQYCEAIEQVKGLDSSDFASHARMIMARAKAQILTAFSRSSALRQSYEYLDSTAPHEINQSLDQFRVAGVRCAGELLRFSEATADPPDVISVWQNLNELAEMKPRNIGGNKEQAKAVRASLKLWREAAARAVEQVPGDLVASDEGAFRCCAYVISLIARASSRYDASKREHFNADYNDLIALALNALKQPGSAARRFFNESIAEIMVDEFQDTNTRQSELLGLLGGERTTLFMIGDDKQSIYKFQGADVATFNSWKMRIASADGGKLLSLSRSFRSHPQIVKFVNAFFSHVMPSTAESQSSFDAHFQSLDAARAAEYDHNQRVEVICYTPITDDQVRSRTELNRRAEAVAVANYILDKVSAGAPIGTKGGESRAIRYGDFAVLVQRNQDFSAVEDALVHCGIPYVMLGGRSFLERQEIYDLENLLAFLAEPLDNHALVGALRSPMFAVSDDLLHAIGSSRSPGTSLWQSLLTASRQRKPGLEAIKSAVAQLKLFIHDARRMQLSHLLRKIIERTAYDVVLLTLPNGRQRSRNLWKLVALAADKEELTCGEFAQRIRTMRSLNVQQSDAPLDTKDSVKLMTIHSSKGLEFPAVLLPVLDVPAVAKSDRLVFHRNYGLAFNTARSDDDEKPAWFKTACSINDAMEEAEKKRLFYVAATRARDYLALFVDGVQRKVPSFSFWIKQWLGLDIREVAEAADSAALAGAHSDVCSVQTVEIPLDREDYSDAATDVEGAVEEHRGESTLADGVRMTWDLIWSGMESETSPPAPNAGHRITTSSSRLHLEPTVIGTFFHALMEHLSADPSSISAANIRSLAFAQGVAVADRCFFQELMDEGVKLFQIFSHSELCVMLKTARKRFHEIPYVIKAPGCSAEMKRPDLVFEDHHGQWHIVDYKTDHISHAEVMSHVQQHSRQLAGYAADLQKLTGLTFKVSLYFAQLGLLAEAPVAAPARLFERVARV